MGRSVYEQPGTKVDGILSQQGGFQVSKGKWKGGKKESEKGKQKARGCAIIVSRCHRGGRMRNINAWYLDTHMVYL